MSYPARTEGLVNTYIRTMNKIPYAVEINQSINDTIFAGLRNDHFFYNVKDKCKISKPENVNENYLNIWDVIV